MQVIEINSKSVVLTHGRTLHLVTTEPLTKKPATIGHFVDNDGVLRPILKNTSRAKMIKDAVTEHFKNLFE